MADTMNSQLGPEAWSEQRYSRQRDVVPADRLAACRISLIGVGAVGRQLALQLAAMGAGRLQLIDPDLVEAGNLASQGYAEADLGRAKVDATAEACRRIHSGLSIQPLGHRFRRSMEVGDVVLSAVDAIDVRRRIWTAAGERAGFFADARATAETIRVVTAADPAGRAHYPTTLFAAAEAHAGACTSKMTIFTAAIAAGLVASQLSRWLRGLPTDCDLTLNLLASELTVA